MNTTKLMDVDRKIQLAGGKNAGAAKVLLRKLIESGSKGHKFSSKEAACSHADVVILIDLGYATIENKVVFAGIKSGVKVVIAEKLAAQLQPKNANPKRKKVPNEKKAFLWGNRQR